MDELRSALRELHLGIGRPTYLRLQEIADQAGLTLPTSTIGTLLSGPGRPRLATVHTFVQVCARYAAGHKPRIELDPADIATLRWTRLHERVGPGRVTGSSERSVHDLTLSTHWDPRARGVERAARPGWFFTGRRAALVELSGWLTSAPPGQANVRIITGGPGSGKSGLLARLVTLSDAGYRRVNSPPIAADDPLQELSCGVIDVAVHARRKTTTAVIGEIAAGVTHSVDDVDQLIDALLARAAGAVIVVDAVDESAEPLGLARALRRVATETADIGVQLLIGTRPGGPRHRILQALGVSPPDGDPTVINLDDERYLAHADLAEYVRRRLLARGATESPELDMLAARIADSAHPSFLIAQLVTRSVTVQGDHGQRGSFPATVDQAMDEYLATAGTLAEQDRLEDLLRPLAYARGEGLPHDHAGIWPRLATALAMPGREYTSADVSGLLSGDADYLIETVVDEEATYYRLYHEALAERLRERDQPRPFEARHIVYEALQAAIPRDGEMQADWSIAHPYLRKCLPGHAAAADTLRPLLDDVGFLVHADPPSLAAALGPQHWLRPGAAQVYRHVLPWLHDCTTAERAAILLLAARTGGQERFADRLMNGRLRPAFTVPWAAVRSEPTSLTLGRHENWVTAVATGTLDGTPIALSGTHDGVIQGWDLLTGIALGPPIDAHKGPVNVLSIVAADQGMVLGVSGSWDRDIRVWDLQTWRPVGGPLQWHETAVNDVAIFRRDGAILAVSVSGGGLSREGRHGPDTIAFWDLPQQRLLASAESSAGQWMTAVDVCEIDGKWVAVTGGSSGIVEIWDLAPDRLTAAVLNRGQAAIVAIRIRHIDGRLIAIVVDEGQLSMWDVNRRSSISATDTPESGRLQALTTTVLDGRDVAITAQGGYESYLQLWDLSNGSAIGALPGDRPFWTSTVSALEIGDRHIAVSGGGDHSVRLWSLSLNSLAAADQPSELTSVTAVGVVGGRPVVATAGYWQAATGIIRILDLMTGGLACPPIHAHTRPITAMEFVDIDGRCTLVSGSDDHTMQFHDVATGRLRRSPVRMGSSTWITSIRQREMRGNRVLVVTGGWDGGDGDHAGLLKIWSVAKGRALKTMRDLDSQVKFSTILHVDGLQRLVSVTLRGVVTVWDLDDLTPVTSASNDRRLVWAAAALRGDATIAAVDDDGWVDLWDLRAGHSVAHWHSGQSAEITALAVVTIDGEEALASVARDGMLRITALSGVPLRAPIPLGAQPVSMQAVQETTLIIGLATGVLRMDLAAAD
ncbi:hypothetical protein [Amycolatopsis sp. CA-128772]|uniref:hypothetical protein n=1 Tax=Amycolatopsis sp. CA-128772 TaxID=2073159 RepID=UPI0011B0341E|nr:hypothetical protein [Amycolatopsis sp. CA-128772]